MRDYKEFFPEVHADIVGTDADPSEDDSLIPAFWSRVRELFAQHYSK